MLLLSDLSCFRPRPTDSFAGVVGQELCESATAGGGVPSASGPSVGAQGRRRSRRGQLQERVHGGGAVGTVVQSSAATSRPQLQSILVRAGDGIPVHGSLAASQRRRRGRSLESETSAGSWPATPASRQPSAAPACPCTSTARAQGVPPPLRLSAECARVDGHPATQPAGVTEIVQPS
jgi:hypothetical protein